MNSHELLYLGLSAHRGCKELLGKLPATEHYRGLRALLLRTTQKIERAIVVTPESVINNEEV